MGDVSSRGRGNDVCPHLLDAAGTFFFPALDLRYLSHNSVVDAPIETMITPDELYVNCDSPASRGQCTNASRCTTALDAASAISKHGCSQEYWMC
jgi:hypothetical protein